MTHRADEILTAVARAHESACVRLGWKVFKHRRETMADREDQLPAFSIDFGADEPDDSQSLRAISSRLSVVTTAVCVGEDEQAVRAKLLEMREQSDTIFHDQMFGGRFDLSFVYGIGYGGAAEPETNPRGEVYVGAYSMTWIFGYRLR